MNLKNFRSSLYLFPLLLVALWQTGSCHGENPLNKTQTQHRVAKGIWGGENVRMEVTDDGANLQFSCSSGAIDGPLPITDGKFEVKGTFTRQTPGPTRENGPKPQPATFRGSVDNEKMALTVTLAESKELLGEFTLELGKPGRVRRCY